MAALAADLDGLAASVLATCGGRGLTLATVESCTGGMIAAALTAIAGSSDVVDRGYVVYSNDAKREMLGVPLDLLAAHGAVSEPVAIAMAEGALRRSGVAIAVAVTGIAGPGGGSPAKPVGLVHVACAHEKGHRTVKLLWGADRSFTKILSAKTALNLVRLHLLLGPGNY